MCPQDHIKCATNNTDNGHNVSLIAHSGMCETRRGEYLHLLLGTFQIKLHSTNTIQGKRLDDRNHLYHCLYLSRCAWYGVHVDVC